MTTRLDEIKQLVEFMQSRGVIKFKAGDVEVEFGMALTSPSEVQKALLGDTPQERLSNLKSALEDLKSEAETDELWSV